MTFPGYNLHPRTFDEMLAACREQLAYRAELGHNPPFNESIVIAASAMFDEMLIIDDLRKRMAKIENTAK